MKALLIATLLGSILLASASDSDIEQDTEQNYCEMVALYEQSNGDLGWPNYKNTYQGCK